MKYMSESEKFMDLAEKSLDDLRKVEGVSERMFWNSLYYSVFYAAKAALLELGFEPKTHQGVDSLVGKILYKEEGLINSEDAKFFSRMKTTREEIDYNPEANIDHKKEEMKEEAEDFIQLMKNIRER